MTDRIDDQEVSSAVSDRSRTDDLRRAEDSERLDREYEDAQGQVAYVDPDTVIPASGIVEGPQGEESFTSDEFDDQEDRRSE